MINSILGFSIKLLLIIGITFGLHIFILTLIQAPLFGNRIIAAYIVNYILAIIIYSTLHKLKRKYLDILGFIFMGGSLLKFVTYFIFFYPFYREDGSISKFEPTSFLVPYIICLIFETFYLIKLLNKKV